MTIYVWGMTAEEQEKANATQWARNKGAILVPDSASRRKGFLANCKTGDTLVIVAHGSATAIGTSHHAVSYSPTTLADTLVDDLGLQNGATVNVAACDTTVFAVQLQKAIRGKSGRDEVTCKGQNGKFAFSLDFSV